MIYLLADTHFNHAFLVDEGLRLAEFDREMWRGLEQMPVDAWLIHLGDASIGDDDAVHRRINEVCPAFRRVLVRGNHDQRSPGWYLERGWSHVTDGMVLWRFGLRILFTHEPVPLPGWIDLNIHGHLHAGVHRGPACKDGKRLLVSCEQDGYMPRSLRFFMKKHLRMQEEKL